LGRPRSGRPTICPFVIRKRKKKEKGEGGPKPGIPFLFFPGKKKKKEKGMGRQGECRGQSGGNASVGPLPVRRLIKKRRKKGKWESRAFLRGQRSQGAGLVGLKEKKKGEGEKRGGVNDS